MLAAPTHLGIALRNTRIRCTPLEWIKALRRICDFRGDILTLRLLRKTSVLAVPWRLINNAEDKVKGLNLTEGNIVLKLCMETGNCTEDVEFNPRGDTMILNVFVILISLCKLEIPSKDERY